MTANNPGQTYRDSGRWTIEVPPGWHAVRFSDSKDGITSTGVQLSNTQLPPPTLIPGYPIQVNDQVLPERGVGLIIATDTDPSLSHGPVAVPPLPASSTVWAKGSAPAGAPYMQTLWFQFKARSSSRARRSVRRLLAAISRPSRQSSARSAEGAAGRARCVPDRAVNGGEQRSLSDTLIRPPTCERAGS